MKQYILLLFLTSAFYSKAQDTLDQKTSVKYQISLNATLDKSIVQRLIIMTKNSLIIENEWTKFEPTVNYSFGHVQPNGLPRTDLENDLFILLENHFLPNKAFFPSVITGFENSPNLRGLQSRYLAGAGVGRYVFKKPNNFMHFNFYGLYEASNFKNLNYDVFRIMPSVKGRLSIGENKFSLIYSASYGQALTTESNFRFRAFIKPTVKISKQLSFNIMYNIWYENTVNEMSPEEISILTFGFALSNL